MLHVGHKNYVRKNAVVSIASIQSTMSVPIKQAVYSARDTNTLVDLTAGRRTRSVIFTASNQVILSAVEGGTLAQRLESDT